MSQEFKTGLCSCTMHTPSLLEAWCCGPCQLGRQCEAVENGQIDTSNMTKCIMSCFCMPCAICQVRRKVVEKYDIDEGSIGSCLKSILCGCCSVAQTYRELSQRKLNPGGFCISEPFEMN